jgi:type II secretory pathway component PulJ
MIHLQRNAALKGRLAQIDADVARHHARGDRTDVNELLDERFDLVQRLAFLGLQSLA